MAKTTPKKVKPRYTITLLVAGMPTEQGRIYPPEVLQMILERLTIKPEIIVQEMNPVERQLKKIPIAEPWEKKIMATVKEAEIVDNSLSVTFECRLNRDGKKLASILDEMGMDSVEFMPVGYGTANEQGIINPDYRLNYIAAELKKK